MSRAFFDQIDDELRGLLGPALRSYHSERNGRLLKLWYGHPAAHFEVQMVGKRWSPTGGPALEVGLHLEHPDPQVNQELLTQLTAGGWAWRETLPLATTGPALGPRGAQWRRLSEFLEESAPDDSDLASETAERLARYVQTLWPLLREQVNDL
ncbi:MAG: hypothetical protein NVSMB32_09600 [Actinomycetota bacterium]